MKLDKINEIQAHSKPIERMRLSFDNTKLFTVGRDGCLIIHEVKERDPKGKGAVEKRGLEFSDEILTEKTEIDAYQQEKETLENELVGQGPDSFDKVIKVKKLDEQINKLQEELSSSNLLHRQRYDSLLENKRELENSFEEQIRSMQQAFQSEIELAKNEYSHKMLEDAARFQDLTAKKEEEARQFQETIAEAIETHNQTINELMDRHHTMMEGQTAATEQMRREI